MPFPNEETLFNQQAQENLFRNAPVLEYPEDNTKFLDGTAEFQAVAGGAGVFQSASITLTAAQLIALAGNHIELLAGIVGKKIVVQSAVFEYIAGAAPFTSGVASPILYLTRTACVASILANVGIPPGQNNYFTGEGLFGNVAFRQGIHLDTLTSSIDIESFFFSGDTAEAVGSGISVCMVAGDAIAAGDGSVKVTIFYAVLD